MKTRPKEKIMIRLLRHIAFVSLVLMMPFARAATPVLTRSYNDSRTSADLTETLFTPQLIASKGLKRLKSLIADDDPRIEAQPLYVPDLLMSDGKKHNVVFVASMGNHVFAFDADAPQGHDLLWKAFLGEPYRPPDLEEPGEHRRTSSDRWGINIDWGILSTPVIDLDNNTLYCVNWMVQADGNPVLFLHRLRLRDGKETSQPAAGLRLKAALTDAQGKPVTGANGKPVTMLPDQKQRAALLLTPLSGAAKILFVATTGGKKPGDPLAGC